MNNPLTMLPPKARGIFYALVFIAGIVIGSYQASFDALNYAYPSWLVVSDTVFNYLAAAGVLTALSNTPTVKGTTLDHSNDPE